MTRPRWTDLVVVRSRYTSRRRGEGAGPGISGALALAACVGLVAASSAEGTSGPVVGWGYNGFGQATPAASVTTPAIAAGGFHSCAVESGTGAVVCWATTPPDRRRRLPP
jgi:hypothetical protein